MLLSHDKAVERFRASGNKAKIGIVVDLWNRVPLDETSEADKELAPKQNALAHGNYLRPIFSGRYDERLCAHLKEKNIDLGIKNGDLELISAPLNFYGLNCYNRVVVSATGADVRKAISQNGGNFLQNGNEFYPDAIYDAVKIIREEYSVNIPIYITENGVGFENESEINGVINDEERIRYLQGSFRGIERANAEDWISTDIIFGRFWIISNEMQAIR